MSWREWRPRSKIFYVEHEAVETMLRLGEDEHAQNVKLRQTEMGHWALTWWVAPSITNYSSYVEKGIHELEEWVNS
ncbi:MAG: hypothetical protein ACXABY_14095 [Candidatus Thorarchaeota archaeon]|jgi:hypothetical protein